MGFYNELMAAKTASDPLSKTASLKDSATIRAELESANISGSQMEIIASEILGMFDKKAEELAVDPAAAAVEDAPVVAAADLTEEGELAAIESAKASLEDATSAIAALEEMKDAGAASEAPVAPVEEAPAAPEAPVAEKTAEEKEEDSKEDDSKEDDSEEEDSKEEKPEEDESEDKEASEEYDEEVIKLAYDKALLKLANSGMTLYDYVAARVGDEHLASEISDKSYKLAALSDQNSMKVADDIIYHMEKSASEF